MRQGALTLADANAQIAQLQQQLIDKDLELSIYLQVAASFQEKDNNRAAAAGNSSSNSALEREVRELRERVRVLSSTGNAVSSSTALVPASPWAMVPMIPPPRRQTPLQGALAEINYAFDLLDARGDGVISRWDLLKGMMDVPEVRGLLRLGGSADQAELNELIGEMSGEGQNTVGRHEFEHFFTRREIERAGGGGSGGGSDASTKDKPGAAAKGGKGGLVGRQRRWRRQGHGRGYCLRQVCVLNALQGSVAVHTAHGLYRAWLQCTRCWLRGHDEHDGPCFSRWSLHAWILLPHRSVCTPCLQFPPEWCAVLITLPESCRWLWWWVLRCMLRWRPPRHRSWRSDGQEWRRHDGGSVAYPVPERNSSRPRSGGGGCTQVGIDMISTGHVQQYDCLFVQV